MPTQRQAARPLLQTFGHKGPGGSLSNNLLQRAQGLLWKSSQHCTPARSLRGCLVLVVTGERCSWFSKSDD